MSENPLIKYGLLYKGYEKLHKILSNSELRCAILEGNPTYESIKRSHTFQKFDSIIEDLNDAFNHLNIQKIYKTFLPLIVYYEINTYILKNIIKYCKASRGASTIRGASAHKDSSSGASLSLETAYRRLFYIDLLGNREYLNFSRANSTATTFDIQPGIDLILQDAISNLHSHSYQDKKVHYFCICEGDAELSISFLFWSYLYESRDFDQYIHYIHGLVFEDSNRMYSQFIVEFVLNYAYDTLENSKNYLKKMSYNGMPIVEYNVRDYVLGIETDISKVFEYLPEEIKQEHNLELIPNTREEYSNDPYVFTEIQVNHIENKLHLTTSYLHDDTLLPTDTQYQNSMLSITSEYNRSSYIIEMSNIIKDLIYARKEHNPDFIGGIFQIIVGIVLDDIELGNVYTNNIIKRSICVLYPFIEKMQIQCGLYQQVERNYSRGLGVIALHERENQFIDSIKWNINYIGFFMQKYKEKNYLFIERKQLLIFEKAIAVSKKREAKNSARLLYKLNTTSGHHLLRQIASMLGSKK